MKPAAAWRLLAERLEPLPAESVPRRSATGRVLAAPLTATVDVPAADVSAMDGYAYAGDLEEGAACRVVATVAAGEPPGLRLDPGTAAAIMTGAPVPAGADRVVPIERTDGGRDRVVVRQPVEAGANIRRHAEVLGVGDPILPAGAVLGPGAMALVATHGYAEVPVHRSPSVAVLVTGDEVVPPERTPAPGQLRDSHTDFLLAAGTGLGLRFDALGISPDDPETLARSVAAGLASDVLLISGGVSMGEFDFVEDVLADHGCEVLFDRVDVQPGEPLVAARHDGGLVFGLPGNPASVMVCFWLFVRPALRRLMGFEDRYCHAPPTSTLAPAAPEATDLARFLPALIPVRYGELLASLTPGKGSHDLLAYGSGSAIARIPAGSSPSSVGDPCEILPLVNWPADADAGGTAR